MIVPNFKILGTVVPEKSLTKKKFTHTDTRKRQKLYTPYILRNYETVHDDISLAGISLKLKVKINLGELILVCVLSIMKQPGSLLSIFMTLKAKTFLLTIMIIYSLLQINSSI